MAKKANLANALDDVTPPPAVRARPEPVQPSAPVAVPAPDRLSLVGAHLPARYGKALKMLAAETELTQRELLEEALNMLFVKKGAKHLGVEK